jgi:hypothetical protein
MAARFLLDQNSYSTFKHAHHAKIKLLPASFAPFSLFGLLFQPVLQHRQS